MNVLYRSLPVADLEVKQGRYTTLEGRCLPYWTPENVGLYVETWASHALNASTVNSSRSLPLMLFHNGSWPIGRSVAWQSAPDGLHGTWHLNDSDDAQRAAHLVDSSDLTGLSIGFQAIRSDWSYAKVFNPAIGWDGLDHVLRLEGRLLEVSIVSTPAFADATIASVRTAPAITHHASASSGPRRIDRSPCVTYPYSTTAWRIESAALHRQHQAAHR